VRPDLPLSVLPASATSSPSCESNEILDGRE
jgi:hypothetical protein